MQKKTIQGTLQYAIQAAPKFSCYDNETQVSFCIDNVPLQCRGTDFRQRFSFSIQLTTVLEVTNQEVEDRWPWKYITTDASNSSTLKNCQVAS